MDVKRFMRQHDEIWEVLGEVKSIIDENIIENNPMAVATQINQLAGKLKIHLSAEDQHLYPFLLKSNDEKIKKLAMEFMEEMGNISLEFTNYKDKFNTKTKILSDVTLFKSETIRIFKILENRIKKEDKNLYPVIASS